MNKVFEIASNTPELVVVKVNADDPLTVAMHPYISSNMAYISITKGRDHVLTTILKDGTHGVHFDWGYSGYTLISEGLENLKRAVVDFIEKENYIPLELQHTIHLAELYYNSNFGSWQLTFNDHEAHIWEKKCSLCYDHSKPDNEHGLKWGTDTLKKIIGDSTAKIDWQYRVAQTGIDMWEAKIA